MCIIIKKPTGVTLDEKIYRECFRIHSDGLGITYVDTEKKALVTVKGFMKADPAIAVIQEFERFEMLIHFRRVSRGMVSKENCHPFTLEVNETAEDPIPRYSFSIAHNGTLPFWSTGVNSDTFCFVNEIMKQQLEADPWFLDRRAGKWFFEEAVGRKNKIVVMRYDNQLHEAKTYIINENVQGTNTAHNCWFSNQTWYPPATPIQQRLYPGAISADGEGTPDHIGWIWRASRQMFENINSHAWINALSYRNPMDNDYTYEGKPYRRIGNLRSNDHTSPIQTTFPKVVSIVPTNNTVVPRDPGVIPIGPDDGDDDITRGIDLAQRLGKCDMSHLSNRQKKELRRLAKEFTTSSLGEQNVKEIDVLQQITYLRNEYMEAFPNSANLTLEKLDEAILDAGGIEPKAEKEDASSGHHLNGYAGGVMGMGYLD